MPQIDANRNASRKAVKRVVRKKKATAKATPKATSPSRQQVRNARAQERQYVSQGKAVKKAAKSQQVVSRARAQEKSYVSQGKAVEKAANSQRKKRLKRQTGIKVVAPLGGGGTHKPSLHELEAIDHYRSAPKAEQKRLDSEAFKRFRLKREASTAAKVAPVLKVLEQTTRPLHAVAATERSVIKDVKSGGHVDPIRALKAASRGIQNKDKSTSSDVLKDLGVKNKTIRGVAGFAGDVVGDPLTYVTGGAGSVARHAALKEAERVTAKAVKKGLTNEQAARMGERAAKRAVQRTPDRTGLTVKVAGHEVPGVRRATAQAARPVKPVTRRIAKGRVAQGVKNAAADVNPGAAPAGVSKAQSESVRRITRTARAKTNRGLDEAQQQAVTLRKRIGEKNYSTVIDALESGNLKGLTPELRKAAVQVRSQLRYANRLRKQAGIPGGERKNYVPHARVDKTTGYDEDIPRVNAEKGGIRNPRPGHSKKREVEKSIAELRAEGRTIKPGEKVPKDVKGLYSEDLPLLYANRAASGKASVAQAEMNRALAAEGKRVKPGTTPDLKALAGQGEAVFHIKGGKIRQVTDAKEMADWSWRGKESGQLVVLNKDLAERALEGASSRLDTKGLVRRYDQLQSGFKRVATATPGFHVRNLVGDTQNAYLGQSGRRLPGNMVRSARTLKAAGRQERAVRNLERPVDAKGTIKTGKYGKVSYDEVARQLAKVGGYRSGFVARETKDLARSGDKGLKISRPKTPRLLRATGLNREDLPRVSTAIDALRNGATYEEAAAHVAKYHFDYGDLTDFERNVARRFAPFYTFSARNIPLQAKTLVTKPGKYAVYQKAREEGAKASGQDQDTQQVRDVYNELTEAGVKLPEGWQRNLSEWEQRNAGIPISWKGHKFTMSFGLPLTDLNEIPGAAGSKQFDEYFQKLMGLSTATIKNPVEYFSNYSFFFRDQIERDSGPNVAAPSYVGRLPQSVRDDLKVVRMKDEKTGKSTWGWPAKVDYIVKQVPGTPNFVQQMMTQGTDRRGKGKGGRLLSYMGLKSVPVEPLRNATSLAYERKREIQKAVSSLGQQGVNADHPNAQYRRLKAQDAKLSDLIKSIDLGPEKGSQFLQVSKDLRKTVARKAQIKKTVDSFYYTKDYQAVLDREKKLRAQLKTVTGEKSKKTVRLSRRPLTLRQQLEQEAAKLRGGGLREELTKQLERERAKNQILSDG